jgi:hypothetical protein
MRTIGLLCLVLVLTGCSTYSWYSGDPRARCVGPDYLEAIKHHPPDRHTQYYYPALLLKGGSYMAITPSADIDPKIHALLSVRPESAPGTQESSGKGWRYLEARGIPFRCGE